MRARTEGPVLIVRAIAGLHVIILAWDFRKGQDARKKGLLGFAIERTQFDAKGKIAERYMLRGIKRFEHKDQGLPPGTLVPLSEHPVQSLLWGDYTVKPGVRYAYRVIPVYGSPKLITLAEESATTVEITTEKEAGQAGADGLARHDIYFNRGVIGSQAYARQFPGQEPDPEKPDSDPMKWLSRGLFEGLKSFIARAKSERYALRGAFYEFHYPPALTALREAFDACQDVQIVFDAESSYKKGNIAAMTAAGLSEPGIAVPRTVTEGIRHNKFLVLMEKGKGGVKVPIAVWTGSTNISPGGIFGHSNVGHVVWDGAVAKAYLDYWGRLAENKSVKKLRKPNREASPTPDGPPPPGSVTALFSPRDEDGDAPTLAWYAQRMADAKEIVCITIAFNLDPLFQEVIQAENDVLRYIVKDDDLADGEIIGRDHDVIFAAGGKLEGGALANFLKENENPLNRNDYIHTKFMLVDPLGADPVVVTGSANFSRASQQKNDENMLVIRGDTRVADIYFGEFMRIFDHHYARYIVRKLSAGGTEGRSGYLKVDTADWLPSHFSEHSFKSKRRRYFVGEATPE